MALTKIEKVDKIESVGDIGHIQIREATIIMDGETEVGRSSHRRVLHPCIKKSGSWSDTDISGEAANVQAVCNAIWTDEIKTAYKAEMDALEE